MHPKSSPNHLQNSSLLSNGCFVHSQKLLEQTLSQRRLCSKCLNNLGCRDMQMDDQKISKKQGIEKFTKNVSVTKTKLNKSLKDLHIKMDEAQIKMHSDKAQMAYNFKRIIQSLQEKENQLTARLIQCYNIQRKNLKNYIDMLIELENSLDRYTQDVSRNYDDILNELKLPIFRQVINEYNQKLKQIAQKIEKVALISQSTVTIYLPIIDIQKTLQKAMIQCLQSPNHKQKSKKRSQSTFRPNGPSHINLGIY